MNNWLYILFTFLVSYTIRVLPFTLIRKPITNSFIRSFLYYVPYITLAVMTFPAILYATKTPISGLLALFTGVFLAYRGKSYPIVAVACCIVVFLFDLLF
ncbi:MAG: AzlD domain-containing protein [Solobacterium sp.]|nr:AzlD domain-containing protein [Solobacterium sp.]